MEWEWVVGGAGFTQCNNNTIIHVPDRTGNTLQNVSVTKTIQNNKKQRQGDYRDIQEKSDNCPASASKPH